MHTRLLVNVVDDRHLLRRELDQLHKIRRGIFKESIPTYSDVLLHAPEVRALRNGDRAPLNRPGHRNLCRGRVMCFGDLDKVGVVKEKTVALACTLSIRSSPDADDDGLTERRVRSQQDSFGITHFLEREVRKTRMHLDLVYSRNYLAVRKKDLEGPDGKVGNTEGTDFA